MSLEARKAAFIKKAIAKHGDKYDYSLVEYTNCSTKIKIVCKDHGPFFQSADKHLNCKTPCMLCRGVKVYDLDSFLSAAKANHGSKYCYGDVKYVSQQEKVSIICRSHGAFLQTPNNHISSNGCPDCGGRKLKTTEVFISDAIKRHGDAYGYSLARYVNKNTNVEIICKKHGSFTQAAGRHLQGAGCAKCGFEKSGRANSKNINNFIEKAVSAHGERYEYSKVEYTGSNDKVEIICKLHGSFLQTPSNHYKGAGCPKCSGRYRTTKEWVDLAIEAHGDRYGYDLVKYRKFNDKVKITCSTHGVFEQSAENHLQGSGCPRCPKGYDRETRLYLITNGEQVKVGIAIDIDRRLGELRRGGQPFTSDLVATWSLPDHPSARAVESKAHRLLSDHNAGLTGFDGATEWFNVSPQVAADAVKRCLP